MVMSEKRSKHIVPNLTLRGGGGCFSLIKEQYQVDIMMFSERRHDRDARVHF